MSDLVECPGGSCTATKEHRHSGQRSQSLPSALSGQTVRVEMGRGVNAANVIYANSCAQFSISSADARHGWIEVGRAE